MSRSARRAWVGACLAVALVGCGGGSADVAASDGTRPGVLSMTLIPRLSPYPDTAAALAATYAESEALARQARLQGRQLSMSWGALEPADAGYDPLRLKELRDALDAASAQASTLFVGLQPINTNHRDLPGDLAGRPFDDPVVMARFRALLDRVVGDGRGRIGYLSLGNEVDIYLDANPGELQAYVALLKDAIRHARRLDPSMKLGVTITADGVLGSRAATVRQLSEADTDVLMLTYYPMRMDATGRFRVREPSVVAEDFRRLLAFAGSKPLVFQEVGYPASAANHSSQALQSEFVARLFAAWRAADGRIPYLNILSLHDFTPQMCEQFVGHYGMPADSGFREYLCTLGLRQSDGTARTAWYTLLDEVAKTSSD